MYSKKELPLPFQRKKAESPYPKHSAPIKTEPKTEKKKQEKTVHGSTPSSTALLLFALLIKKHFA